VGKHKKSKKTKWGSMRNLGAGLEKAEKTAILNHGDGYDSFELSFVGIRDTDYFEHGQSG
jgi:hypothetical protein